MTEKPKGMRGWPDADREDFAAMLDDLFASGGPVSPPAPLIVNSLFDISPEHLHMAFPPMTAEQRSRMPPLVLHITMRDEVSPGLRSVADDIDRIDPTWRGPGVGYTNWGDPAADPLADIQAFIATMKPPPMTLTMTRRMQCKIARRTMSKRAYRRWRGRTR